MIIDASYGIDYYGAFVEGVEIDVRTLGPIGLKLEYLLSEKVGAGVLFYYANSGAEWISTDNYTWEGDITRIRFMGMLNFHFATTDQLDPYFLVGAGYANTTAKLKTNDPSEEAEQSAGITIIPVAFRTAIGARYFFTENIGANMEFGLGSGSYVQAGLSFKF